MTVPTCTPAAPQRGEEKAMQLTLVVGKSRQSYGQSRSAQLHWPTVADASDHFAQYPPRRWHKR